MAQDNLDQSSKSNALKFFRAAKAPSVDPVAHAQKLINEASVVSPKPVHLIQITALQGSGKSPLARQIAGKIGAVLIEKDLLGSGSGSGSGAVYKQALATKILGAQATEETVAALIAELADKPEGWCTKSLNAGLPVVLCNTAVENSARVATAIVNHPKIPLTVAVQRMTINLALSSDANQRFSEQQQIAARFLSAVGSFREYNDSKEPPKNIVFSGRLSNAPLANMLQTLSKLSKEIPNKYAKKVIRAEVSAEPESIAMLDHVATIMREMDSKKGYSPAQISALWDKASEFKAHIQPQIWDADTVNPIIKDVIKYPDEKSVAAVDSASEELDSSARAAAGP